MNKILKKILKVIGYVILIAVSFEAGWGLACLMGL